MHRTESDVTSGLVREIALTPDEIAESAARAAQQVRTARADDISWRLLEIDRAAIRPLRAIAAGTGTGDDMAKLSALETEAEALRAELAAL